MSNQAGWEWLEILIEQELTEQQDEFSKVDNAQAYNELDEG